MPFESKISSRTEYGPVCGSLIGAKGKWLEFASERHYLTCSLIESDLSLIRLAQETFESAGWRTSVDTGRLTFPVGENSRRVADDSDRIGRFLLLSQLAIS